MGKGKSSDHSPICAEVSVAGINGSSFTVTPGLIDEAAQLAYLNGQCAALAVALSEIQEGEIIAIGYDETSEDYEEWEANPSWGHVGFELPGGTVLDIEGPSKDLDSWMERHQYWEVKQLSKEQALNLPDFPEQDLAVARSMARALLPG